MLWEEAEKFRELSGEDPEEASIARIGGFLDGYEKALSDVPDICVGDTIYRQAAIDVIKHVEVHFTVKSAIDFSAHKKAVHEIIDHILDAQEKALGELPSTEKTWDWIPCKERLPDTNHNLEGFLTTVKYHNERDVFISVYENGKFGHWDGHKLIPNDGVIAWMEVPEPYQGDE